MIFKSYEAWGLEKPQIIEGANFIKCILPRRVSQISLVKNQTEEDVLALFYSQNEITAQRWLNVLIEKQFIERVGKTRNLRYRRIEKVLF